MPDGSWQEESESQRLFRYHTAPDAEEHARAVCKRQGVSPKKTEEFVAFIAERKKRAELFSLRNHFCIM
jgi:hypothetical protein